MHFTTVLYCITNFHQTEWNYKSKVKLVWQKMCSFSNCIIQVIQNVNNLFPKQSHEQGLKTEISFIKKKKVIS